MEAIGVDELAVYESTGVQVVYEGAKLDAFKKQVINVFKNIWSAIKGWFEKVVKFFKDKVKESNKELGSKVTAADIDLLDSEKKFGTLAKFTHCSKKDINMVNDRAGRLANKIAADFDKLIRVDDPEALKDTKDEILAAIPRTLADNDAVGTVADMKNKMKEYALGEGSIEVTKDWLRSGINDLNAVVINGADLSDISVAYKDQKKFIDDAIKEFKKIKGDDEVRFAKDKLLCYTNLSNAFHAAHAVLVDVYRKRYVDYKVVLSRVVSAVAKAKGKTTAKNESYESVTTQVDLVAEAFDW